MTSKLKFSVAAAIAALSFGTLAHGQIFFFGEKLGLGDNVKQTPAGAPATAQASFFANLTNPGVETFENPFTSPTASFTNGVTATLTGGSRENQPTGTNGLGRYPVSGSYYWNADTAFSLNFTQGVAAFGFYGVDIGDYAGQLTLQLFNGVTSKGIFTVPHTVTGQGVGSGAIMYYGVITPFTFDRVVFGNSAAAGVDNFAFDDFTVGLASQVITPVPEPSTYGLLGAAALVAAALHRRRQQAKRAAA